MTCYKYCMSARRKIMLTEKMKTITESVTNNDVMKKAFLWKIRNFEPKVRLCIDSKRFLIKTAENSRELEKALDLRYSVFYRESLNRETISKVDVDRFDLVCDHLLVIDKSAGRIAGTYRLISSTFSDKFYSETEFMIDDLKRANGIKLELGRACVHRDYRTGAAIALLWKGMSEYVKAVGAQYLFVCSSISTTNAIEIGLIYKYVKELYLSEESLRVYPKDKYRVKELEHYLEAFEKFDIKAEAIDEYIPALLKSYFKAGSVICGEPALDRKFKCADFLTVLDL